MKKMTIKNKEQMNEYLKKAFNSLNSNDLRDIIFWLLEKKQRCYDGMQKDIDLDNNLIVLNDLEEKLRIIYGNLIQREQLNDKK